MTQLRFMSFNIQHGVDFVKQVVDLDLMIQTIRDCKADIIGLNEVYDQHKEWGCQAETVGRKLGFHHFFGLAAMIDGDKPYGNALISRYPIQSAEVVPIVAKRAREGYEPRSIIKATLAHPACTLLVSHFGLQEEDHEEASTTVSAILDDLQGPVVLMGDFNMTPDHPWLQPIVSRLRNTLDTNKLSFPSPDPSIRIDYIFVSDEVEVVHAEIPQIVASDHLPHLADLKFP